jgi:hypothetical protein
LNTQIFSLDSLGNIHSAGTALGDLQLLSVSKVQAPFAMTRPVSEHDQPHIRSPLMTAAPTSRLRRARAQEDENHSRKRRFRPWLASVRPPGSARTDQVLEDDGIRLGVFVKRPSSWRLR